MIPPRPIAEFPKPPPRGTGFTPPLSQAEDSTQTSGFENQKPGTARPRVRIREHRPGFQRVDMYHYGKRRYIYQTPPAWQKGR